MNLFQYFNIAVASIVILILVFPFAGVFLSLFIPKKRIKNASTQADIACIITAYKNIDMTQPLVYSILKQDYDNLKIYLVADNCKIQNFKMSHPLLKVLKPEIPLNSKVKSIKYAVKNFVREHEAVLIFDPDNLAAANSLEEINKYIQKGYKAVQGTRKAKNLNSLYACLDAAGEIYYNYTQRYVPFKLGGSATIAGSGMAIEANVFKDYLESDEMKASENKVITDEDKYLQYYLAKYKHVIAFANQAFIYDEKIDTNQQVKRQRARWLNSYFKSFKRSIALFFLGVKNFNFNQIFSAVNQIYPPMFLLISFAFLFALINLLFLNPIGFYVSGAFVLFGLNFLFVLILGKAPLSVWKSLFGIPFFIYNQFKGLFIMKKANKDFLTTQHKKIVSIEEMELNKRQ